MTKKEKEILKKEYKSAVFDCYYWFLVSEKTQTEDDKKRYLRNVSAEITLESLIKALNIRDLLPEEERNELRKTAKEVVNSKYK